MTIQFEDQSPTLIPLSELKNHATFLYQGRPYLKIGKFSQEYYTYNTVSLGVGSIGYINEIALVEPCDFKLTKVEKE